MTVVRGWRGDAAAGKPDGRERDHAALLPARMREAMKTEVSARTHVDVRPQAEFMERLWRNLAGLVKIPSHAGNPAGLHAVRIHANGEKGRRRPPDVRPRRRRRQIRGVHAPGHAAVVRGLRGGQGRPPLHRRSDRGGRHRERPARAGAGRVHGPRLAHAGQGGAIPLASGRYRWPARSGSPIRRRTSCCGGAKSPRAPFTRPTRASASPSSGR